MLQGISNALSLSGLPPATFCLAVCLTDVNSSWIFFKDLFNLKPPTLFMPLTFFTSGKAECNHINQYDVCLLLQVLAFYDVEVGLYGIKLLLLSREFVSLMSVGNSVLKWKQLIHIIKLLIISILFFLWKQFAEYII